MEGFAAHKLFDISNANSFRGCTTAVLHNVLWVLYLLLCSGRSVHMLQVLVTVVVSVEVTDVSSSVCLIVVTS